MNGSGQDATDATPCERHRWCMASIEPSASPSGLTWQASDRLRAPRIASTARSISGCILTIQVSEDLLDSLTTSYRRILVEGKLRGALHPHLPPDGTLQADAILFQGGPSVFGERGEQHGGPPEIRVSLHMGDGDQPEPGV